MPVWSTRSVRLLTIGTRLAVGALILGVVLMIAHAVDALGGGAAPFSAGRLVADLAALRPEGFLWLGLALAIATPVARVAGSLLGYARGGERAMALVSTAILGVIALSVVAGLAGA